MFIVVFMLTFRHILLCPFAALYRMAVGIRNFLYDYSFCSSFTAPVPVIAVGNITVGGTGKTPHIEYLISCFARTHTIAVLSRGYKRKTKGFVLAQTQSTATEIGDEPRQIKTLYPDIVLAVDENRKRGILQLLAINRSVNLILLDDAFQHRRVRPHCSIVLIDYSRPLSSDAILPAGMLREHPRQLKRATIVIITKTPARCTADEKLRMINDIQYYSSAPVFFSSFVYHHSVIPLFSGDSIPVNRLNEYSVLLLTGIAQPAGLIEFLTNQSLSLYTLHYPDHHHYKASDMDAILKRFVKMDAEKKIIVTTSKDIARLRHISIPDLLAGSIYFLPVRVEICDGRGQELHLQIQQKIRIDQ